MIELIFDRTADDVRAAAALRATGRDSEVRLKGCYDHIDRNRVGAAVDEIANRLQPLGYKPSVQGIVDWTRNTLVTQLRNDAMLATVRAARDEFVVFTDTPPLPLTLDFMDYKDANTLERVLFDVLTLIGWAENQRAVYFGEAWYC